VTPEPTATVVVVCRDRWSLALETLHTLLARTDPRHEVVVVDARAPRAVGAAFDRLAAVGRIRVVRRARFLAGNEARNVGADGARTDWIAFVENDAVPDTGWLDALLAVGERTGAASVYPAYLEPARPGPHVHGLGADLELGGPDGRRFLREHQHELGRLWSDVVDGLEPVARVQGEPHAIVMRRDFVNAMGGFDEAYLGWFDHTDVALHHLRLGAESWLVPDVTCVYRQPPPVALQDLPSFSLRWGRDWFDRSLRHLCTTWGLDPENDGWRTHDEYRTFVRRSALTRWSRVNALVDHAAAPIDHVVAQRWDDRRTPVAAAADPRS
jgi:GT2 family glycosyltransferase